MPKHEWKDKALCLDYDTNLFFEKYEDDELLRPAIDKLCSGCPVSKMCFAVGVSQKEWGIWGGVYLEGGQISKEFSKHKSKNDWANTWQRLTVEQ
jgi:signal transduction histidine kinase